MPDYYKVLGLKQNASIDEIKKAFIKLAAQYHPDKHQNKSEKIKQNMEKKFGEIKEAYDFLTNKEGNKKSDSESDSKSEDSLGKKFKDLYPHFQGLNEMATSAGLKGYNFNSDSDSTSDSDSDGNIFDPGYLESLYKSLDDIQDVVNRTNRAQGKPVANIPSRVPNSRPVVPQKVAPYNRPKMAGLYSNKAKMNKPESDSDAEYGKELKEFVEKSLFGKTSDITSKYFLSDLDEYESCVRVKLVVSLEDVFNGATKSIHFNRKVKITGKMIDQEEIMDIKIDQSMKNNDEIRIRGKGHWRREIEGKPDHGDVICTLLVADHPHYKRNGHDLLRTIDLTIDEAKNGCKKAIDHIDGKVHILDIKPMRYSNEILHMTGMGIRTREECGDCIVNFRIIISDKELALTKNNLPMIAKESEKLAEKFIEEIKNEENKLAKHTSDKYNIDDKNVTIKIEDKPLPRQKLAEVVKTKIVKRTPIAEKSASSDDESGNESDSESEEENKQKDVKLTKKRGRPSKNRN